MNYVQLIGLVFGGSLAGSLLAVGIAWGALRRDVHSHTKWLEDHEEKLDDHAERIVRVESKILG
jgi:hypothetical protein